MAEARGFHRRATFVLRVELSAGRLRGHVMAVGTGDGRLFEELDEAMAFIQTAVESGAAPVPRADEEE